MLAQRLKHVGDIESQTMASNGYENVPSWAVWAANVRMSIEPVSGKEAIASAVNQADQVVRIVMRYREGLTAQMRIHALGRYYDVVQPPVNVGERNRMVEFICSVGRHD